MFNKLGVIVSALIFFLVLCIILNKIDLLPGLIIDEIFHIPQGKAYCQGNFYIWDPKITTLPGLYVVTTSIFGLFGLCTTYWLRFTNVIGALLNYLLFLELLNLGNQNVHNKIIKCWSITTVLSAVNLALLPPLFFFSFFYYTDTWSVTAVLLMFVCAERNNHIYAAVAGVFSILMRQTNVMWVAMIAGKFAFDTFMRMKTNYVWSNKTLHYSYEDFIACVEVTLRNGFDLRKIPKFIWYRLMSYVLVILLFAVFVFVNDGIVVGDKSAHKATLHIPQLFYFSMFSGFFGLPHILPEFVPFVYFARNNKTIVLLISVIFSAVIYLNTLVHPYLLADNRHYTFYVWTRIYAAYPYNRYLFIIMYIFSLYAMLKRAQPNMNFGYLFAYIPCMLMILIFQRLVDVRYYLIPYVLLRVKFKSSVQILLFELIFYLCLNYVTINVFFKKEFYWEDFSYPQRLVW